MVRKTFPPVMFQGSGLCPEISSASMEKTNIKIMTDAEKSTPNIPGTGDVGERHTANKEDAP